MESLREERRTVAPTIAGRIHSLDVLRGFAVLGILIANLPSFSGPEFAGASSSLSKSLHGSDAWVQVLTIAFVTGKFRSTLAVLFGVGLFLQFAKRSSVRGNWPGGYLKRTAWLMAFGLAHGLLIWYGDILFAYSLAAFICCWLVSIADKARVILTGVLLGLGTLGGFGLAGLVGLAALLKSGADMASDKSARLAELHAYAVGSYGEQFMHRLGAFGIELLGLIVFLPILVGLFLLGVHLGKMGFFAAPSRHRSMKNMLLWIGFGVGLPLNLGALLFWRTGAPMGYIVLIDMAAGPILAAGYFTLIAMAVEAGVLGIVGKALSNVGRAAFSCYIMQSVLCTAFFYSWGFGWFDKTTNLQDLGVACAVALVNVLFATVWLRWFALGPLEWLWRSLVEGKRLPILRRGYNLTTAPKPTGPGFDLR